MTRILLCSVLASALAWTQTPAPVQRIIGEVTEIDAAGAKFTVKLDKAEETPTKTIEKAGALQYKRVAPGEKDLTKAAPSNFDELATGDRVLVRGKSVIVMAKSELIKKHADDQAEWTKRGMSGVVTAVKPEANELDIEGRGAAAGTPAKTVALIISGKTQFRRYAPDSVKFSDAKVASLKDVAKGDQLRVLGNKSEDGSKLEAEMVVFGTFVTLAGTITKIDAASGVIDIKTFEVKSVKMSIKTTKDSTVKKLPEMMAVMMGRAGPGGTGMAGMRGAGGPDGAGGGRPAGAGGSPSGAPAGGRPTGGPGGGGRPAGAGGPPSDVPAGGRPAGGFGGPGAGGPGGFAGGMRSAGGDFNSMLEKVPVIPITDMKVGDQIIVSSTKGATAEHLTAITILSGVEPLLAARQAAAPQGGRGAVGNWSMDIPVL